MIVKIKKLTEDAVTPSRNTETDAGLDLTAVSFNGYNQSLYVEYGTGIALEIPEGYVGLLFPRSSISHKDLTLCNSVGVIDSSYRGEIKFRFKNTTPHGSARNSWYNIGDKIGQIIIMPYPKVVFEVVDELEETERGENGFGSSGN